MTKPTAIHFHIRMITDHGPQNLRPRVCIEDEVLANVAHTREGDFVFVANVRFKWSPIQKTWIEVSETTPMPHNMTW